MSDIESKAIFIGNVKGGVGKSTSYCLFNRLFEGRFKKRSVMMIDTDPQGTSFELMVRFAGCGGKVRADW